MKQRRAILLAALLAATGGVSAQSMDALKVGAQGDRTDALPAAADTRLVTFRYNDNASSFIRALAGTHVNIEVPEGEVIQGFYLSDPAQWDFHVTGDDRRVLVKPHAAGLVNTGTLVTDKRSYELTIASVPMGEMWFQRVRWVVPSQAQSSGQYWRAGSQQGEASADPTLNAAKLNFRYRIRGNADFAPVTVFDDGTRTWIKFDQVQDLPAIFARHGRDLEVLDYSVQGQYVVIPSVSPELVLRLRKAEVLVERRG